MVKIVLHFALKQLGFVQNLRKYLKYKNAGMPILQGFPAFRYFFKIGVTGFEPATSRPPAVRSNQTEPYPGTSIICTFCRIMQHKNKSFWQLLIAIAFVLY